MNEQTTNFSQASSVALFLRDPAVTAAAYNALSNRGFRAVPVDASQSPAQTALNVVPQIVAAQTGPLCILIDLTQEADAIETSKHLVALAPDAKIVMLGTDSNVNLLHALKAVGVADYWVLPATAADFVGIVETQFSHTTAKRSRGRVSVFCGTAGGIGTATLAAAVAWQLSQKGQTVAAVDAGLESPSLGSSMGADAPGNLPVLLQARDRLDDVLLEQAMVRVNPSLSLIDGFIYRPNQFDAPLFEHAEGLIAKLRETVTDQVWRVPVGAALTRSVLLSADTIFAVTTGTLTALRTAEQLKLFLAQNAKAKTVHWVFVARDAAQAVTVEEAAKHLGVTFDVTVPFVKRLGTESVHPAEFLSGNNALTKAARQTVSLLTGLAPESGSMWRSLWK
ncbi:MAG: PQQ-binding-like beta-propeller repeat protein [Sutterellaceae bacterium]|nr:PQQ-binding-like beta-propeller repeat protein [Sutterellaceae bacterium]